LKANLAQASINPLKRCELACIVSKLAKAMQSIPEPI
jgi:hypothetical protein